MKLTSFLFFVVCLHVSATTMSQKVTLSLRETRIQDVFKEITRQTGVSFIYKEALLKGIDRVTLELKDATIEQVLNACFKGQSVEYQIIDQNVVIKKKSPPVSGNESLSPPPIDIHGRVTDSLGNPLAGASVTVKGGKKGTTTDVQGYFTLYAVKENTTVIVSYTGYDRKEFKPDATGNIIAYLNKSDNPLDQVQVVAYGTVSHRLNTGDVTTVTAKVIEQQPISNPLEAIEGRVPGLLITQTTGLPGGAYTVQIRGRNSIANGNDPFYVVDGVPYISQMAGPILNNQLMGGSPLNYINPFDIESIEVLKDADATAIYGSRAANGAILITTKKGKAGAMSISGNIKSGFTSPVNNSKLLNTRQYLPMRFEAFFNDSSAYPTLGIKPGPADHDVNGDWDTTRYTDWNKVLLNNSAHFTDADLSISGGNANTQYLIGGGFYRQTTGIPVLIPGEGADQKASVHFNLNSSSSDKRFRVTLTGSYVSDKNTVQSASVSSTAISLAPDAPALFNPDGSLNWAPLIPGKPGTWNNPYASLYQGYLSNTSNLISNVVLNYTLLKGLDLKVSVGYTNTQTDENITQPTTMRDPALHATSGTAYFNELNSHAWILEPQANYNTRIGKGVLTALLGASFNENINSSSSIYATGFVNDALLKDLSAASNLYSIGSNNSVYKYEAIFGRLNYDWQDKYIINLIARRDGSSRFGPGNQFANFGSVGAAWIFSKEDFVEKNFSFLSFGKIRASYGNSGNDQIGNYTFLDLYGPTGYPYQGSQVLYPANLFNPNLAWELTKKLEGGIELGFLKDRILIQASFYRNRSNNQLVQTPISVVTGYSTIPANLPALVQNSGSEFVLSTINIKSKDFTWSSTLNLTIARNKLVAFPNLAATTYANTLVVGQPITIHKTPHFTGVNDTTGVYQFASASGQGVNTYNPVYPDDYTSLINLTPTFYGGLENSLFFKGFTLDFLFQFTKQKGEKFWAANGTMPGLMSNQPIEVLNHWQTPGDKAPFQQYSQVYANPQNGFSNATYSDYAYGDASFIRLKNVAVSWSLPESAIKKIHLTNCRIFIQGQNILTITNYDGIDPESQGAGIPPMRVWTGGIQFSL